jgi:[ribosomal protein S5]-alanine N-acetyltransferase
MTAPVPTLALPQPGWTMRAWRVDDAQRLALIANDERIAQWMSDTWPHPYTQADALWWVTDGHATMGRTWALCLHDEPQGGCGAHPQGGFQRCNVEVGWWLSPEHWGQGVVPAAARMLLEQAFADTDVHRVFAPVHAGNQRSMRVAQKAGMVLESVQPKSAFKRGRVIDRHLFAAYRR